MKYKVTVETLTPLHIGTGTDLLAKFDYVSRPSDRMTYVLDQEAVYADELERNGATAQLNKPAGALLSSENWREGSPFVRYTLHGSTTIERVHEQIKDAHGRCYLPGSSLKGALRTAIMAYAIRSGEFKPQGEQLGPRSEWAAQQWEHDAFGRNSNYDLLRALQVADSGALPTTPSALELCSARVFTGGEPSIPVEVEAVRKGTTFQTEITIDELALKYAPELDWEDRQLWLTNLIEILQQTSRQRIEEELATTSAKGFEEAAIFYKRLMATAEALKGKSAAVIQLGWGAGWTGMTVGGVLTKELQDRARQKYKLGKPQKAGRDWEPDLSKSFPKSRSLRAIPSSVGDDRPGLPLGWMLLVFAPAGQPSPEWVALSRKAKAAFKPLADQSVAIKQSLVPPTVEPAPSPVEPTPDSISTKPALPVRPEPPKSKPSVPKPAARPLIPTFAEVPKVGDRFKGEVFDAQGRALQLLIPGLDDTVAYASIAAEDNDSSKKFKEGDSVVCEVIGLEQEKSGCWRVKCRRG
ncbi:MAG: type III-A CRISPR-associated RAMP protein Csm5 [Chloroflexi bacterium]|nr:type III-A CRISPR-associated RAMP protein Csm5 [Chloroflexota bacterium]